MCDLKATALLQTSTCGCANKLHITESTVSRLFSGWLHVSMVNTYSWYCNMMTSDRLESEVPQEINTKTKSNFITEFHAGFNTVMDG